MGYEDALQIFQRVKHMLGSAAQHWKTVDHVKIKKPDLFIKMNIAI